MKNRFIPILALAGVLLALSPRALAAQMLIPVGKVVGLSVLDGSVTVVAFDDSLGESAKAAGLQIGDDILQAGGREIHSVQALHQALAHSDGTVELVVRRGQRQHTLTASPAVTDLGPRLGVYVREGVTGIGTITYYDPQEGSFGALGHGVSDRQGELAQMEVGFVYPATIIGVKEGKAGTPGQLKGAMAGTDPLGILEKNTAFGIFGTTDPWLGEALPVADPQEVKTGQAWILSNVSANTVEAFSVEVVKLFRHTDNGRDMLLRITDPRLLETTGGIVAGMSGSPILQNGKLVGAVTHVLVNDPTTGYGIFIENMLDAAA